MYFSLPHDFGTIHAISILWLFSCWFLYSPLLAKFGRGTLNAQLAVVRRHWVAAIANRVAKPFDSILFGNMVNSISFFGSATLLVLVGVISVFTNTKTIYETVLDLNFIQPISLELFALQVGLLAFVLSLCFLSYTYALRQLIYTTALMGALPNISKHSPRQAVMIDATTTVLSGAIHTLNFGIRGYYYVISTFFIFISPYACILATTIVTAVLVYRQLLTATAQAIQEYVAAAEMPEDEKYSKEAE